MANFRYINTWIWKDPWFVDLRQSEQHLFLYLLSNPNTNVLGIYEISLREMAFDTGLDQEEVKRIFRDRFQPDGRAFYELGFVVMKNWLRHQTLNTNQFAGATKQLNDLPDWLKSKLIDDGSELHIDFEKLTKGKVSFRNFQKNSIPVETKEKKRKENKINKTTSNEVGPVDGHVEPETFGNEQINLLMEHFEKQIGKMPKPVYQRRAAKTLLQRHGFDRTIGGINAVAKSRGERYAPNIANLCDLRDRWIELENFYKREERKRDTGGVEVIS